MTAPVDLLAIGPHPDDVEIFCGGTVASSVRKGHRVAILDVTRGELASRGDAATRASEAAEAARILGVALRENLALPDGGVSDDDPHVARMVEALRRLRPRVILAPWREARHPDHSATAQLVERAAFLARLRHAYPDAGPPHRADQVCSYPMRVELHPSFLVDISEVVDVKRQAILAHASQVTWDAAATPTLVGSADSLDALAARDRYRGAQLGVVAAEAFHVPRAVPVDDPVALFAGRPEPHFTDAT